MPTDVPSVPSNIAVAIVATVTKSAFRRAMNFRRRYPAVGGPASTGSFRRNRSTSVAKAVAVSYRRRRSFSRAFMTIQSSSPLTNRRRSLGSMLRCRAISVRRCPDVLRRTLGRGGSLSRMIRCISA